VVRRRTLLLAGGAALLAGCGKDERRPGPTAAEVMLRDLAAERALAHDLTGAGSRLRRRIAERAAERARRLAAAISAQGGRPHDAPAPDSAPDPAAAAARARAALEAHVAALPSLTGDLRALGADLVVASAADAALLGSPVEPFPGTPR
jgi:hypothetical protein